MFAAMQFALEHDLPADDLSWLVVRKEGAPALIHSPALLAQPCRLVCLLIYAHTAAWH